MRRFCVQSAWKNRGFRTMAGAALMAICGCQSLPPRVAVEPLPDDLARAFTVVPEGCPVGYTLLTDAEVIRRMGLDRNPDYIEHPSERSITASHGGERPVLAVYGSGDDVCLLVNGIYFTNRDALQRFLEKHTRQPNLKLTALEKPDANGSWLILCAVDPDRTYSEAEQQAIEQSIASHSEAIGARILYSSLWSSRL